VRNRKKINPRYRKKVFGPEPVFVYACVVVRLFVPFTRTIVNRSDSEFQFQVVSRWRENNVATALAQNDYKHSLNRRCFCWLRVRSTRTCNGEICAKFGHVAKGGSCQRRWDLEIFLFFSRTSASLVRRSLISI